MPLFDKPEPTEKSPTTAAVLAFLFGWLGLLYASGHAAKTGFLIWLVWAVGLTVMVQSRAVYARLGEDLMTGLILGTLTLIHLGFAWYGWRECTRRGAAAATTAE